MKVSAWIKKMTLAAAGILVLVLASDVSSDGASGGLSPAEIRGRAIYRTGGNPSMRPIMAVAGGDTEIEARLVPCGTCHGMDGRGRQEGSVVPPNIRWDELMRFQRAAGGRERLAYNDDLLVRAITIGVDSSGQRLNDNMPRYALTRAEASDLIAYLKKLSTDYDPGLSDEGVRIGALLPPGGKHPELAAAIQHSLTAYFAELNKGGGVYGRRIELICRELPPEAEKAAPALREFLEKEQAFALVASFIAGSEKPSTAVLEELQVPLVGAWTLVPEARPSPNSPIFYLDSGLAGQAEALAGFALRERGESGAKLEFVLSDDELSQAAVDAARTRLKGSLWETAEEVHGPADASSAAALAAKLAAARVKVLFLALREPQLKALLGALTNKDWAPTLLIPGALYADTSGLPAFSGRIFVAVSSLPSDVSADAAAEYQKLASEYGLSPRHLAAQFTALAEARILTEGLKRAGRDLDRERLVHSVEGLYDFSTGFSPPVSFAPARRTGVTEFHLMAVDPASGHLTEADHARY